MAQQAKMNDKDRWVLFIMFAMMMLMLMQWQQVSKIEEQKRQQKALQEQQATTDTLTLDGSYSTSGTLAQSQGTTGTIQRQTPISSSRIFQGEENLLAINTDHLNVQMTNRGGRPTSWKLILPKSGKGEEIEEVELIPQVNINNTDEKPLEISYKLFDDASYHIFNRVYFESEVQQVDENTTRLIYTSPVVNEMRLTKTYTFKNDSFLTALDLKIENLSASRVNVESEGKGLSLSWGPGIYDTKVKLSKSADLWYYNAFSATDEKIKYGSPTAPKSGGMNPFGSGGKKVEQPNIRWGGLQNKFFAVILIPPTQSGEYSSRALLREKNRIEDDSIANTVSPPYTYELIGKSFNLQPAGTQEATKVIKYKVFTGPIEPEILSQSTKTVTEWNGSDADDVNLNRMMFYSSWFWMKWLCEGLLWLLNFFYGFIGSWGIAIVALTVFVKLVTHPLNHSALKNQALYGEQIRKVKPELDALNEKYKGDAAKRSQEMMKLFKKNGISQFGPLKGCLPMLIQAPILFGLYRIFSQTYSLRGAEFLYISDLAQPDHLFAFSTITFGAINSIPFLGEYFNLLPVLMGFSQFLITKFAATTQPTDPNQKMIMIMLPIMMPFFLFQLPSGLFVYWIVSNLWQFAHTFQTKREVHSQLEQAVENTHAKPVKK